MHFGQRHANSVVNHTADGDTSNRREEFGREMKTTRMIEVTRFALYSADWDSRRVESPYEPPLVRGSVDQRSFIPWGLGAHIPVELRAATRPRSQIELSLEPRGSNLPHCRWGTECRCIVAICYDAHMRGRRGVTTK